MRKACQKYLRKQLYSTWADTIVSNLLGFHPIVNAIVTLEPGNNAYNEYAKPLSLHSPHHHDHNYASLQDEHHLTDTTLMYTQLQDHSITPTTNATVAAQRLRYHHYNRRPHHHSSHNHPITTLPLKDTFNTMTSPRTCKYMTNIGAT